MLTLLSLLVTLSVLILIHEFGHLFAAKSVGIMCPRFSLGFGPVVYGFKRGETEYVLSAIPLGGYVKMAGMEDDEAAELLEGQAPAEPVPADRMFDSKPLWARAWVISAGVIMNLLFAVIVFSGLAAAYGDVLNPSTRVVPPAADAVSGAAAPLASIPFGARVTGIGEKPVSTWEDVQQGLMEAPAGPVDLRLEGLPAVRLDLPASRDEREGLVGSIAPLHEPVVGRVVAGTAAARGGIRAGDRVRAVDGRPVRTWEELVERIEASPGKRLALTVERGGREMAVNVTPTSDRGVDARGAPIRVGKLGVGAKLETVHRPVGPLTAVRRGFEATWGMSSAILVILKKLVTGEVSARSMGGLIAIGEASGESASAGLEVFLGFLAAFSVNLAVLNLLPIPILDGGHLMFLLFEAVRGRPLSVEARIRFSQVGLIFVVGLMLWANGNDILRLLGI